ncbi:MAG: ABC transporter ATP-binding protein, partial [Planctomycetota bacterium]
DDGTVKAVDGVDFRVIRGKTLGIVGESGCGKSVTSMSIMQLLPTPPAEYVAGSIVFKGKNLLDFSEEEMRRVRGNDIAMIFQEPMTSLNPVFRVGDQIMEPLIYHQGLTEEEALEEAIRLLGEVGIPSPESRVHEYPHQMSGGMKQRVMIAMALACNPDLLIADEPTTALDVTIQAQILELMAELQEKHGMSIILITHDLAVIAEMADDVVVMYAGKVVEKASCQELFENPSHPYTIGLLGSIPKLGEEKDRLQTIEGMVPNPLDFPAGCRFSTRCPYATSKCQIEPPLEMVGNQKDHFAACWHLEQVRVERLNKSSLEKE